MSDEQKPGDPADKASDGAFIAWVTAHPTAMLANSEEARLLAEIDRLRQRADRAEAERDEEIARVVRITERLGAETLRAERAERILAALREPSEGMMQSALKEYGPGQFVAFHRTRLIDAIRAAVAAAEQEVGRE